MNCGCPIAPAHDPVMLLASMWPRETIDSASITGVSADFAAFSTFDAEQGRLMSATNTGGARVGLSLRDLVKVTLYLQDLEDFPAFDAMRRAIAPGDPPALAVAQIPRPGPTPDVRLCVEGIAWGADGGGG